jgi:methanogenic corrinoid protein MtbC1
LTTKTKEESIMSQIIHQLFESIIVGNAVLAKEKIKKALEDGDVPSEILNQSMIAAMEEVSERFGPCLVSLQQPPGSSAPAVRRF